MSIYPHIFSLKLDTKAHIRVHISGTVGPRTLQSPPLPFTLLHLTPPTPPFPSLSLPLLPSFPTPFLPPLSLLPAHFLTSFPSHSPSTPHPLYTTPLDTSPSFHPTPLNSSLRFPPPSHSTPTPHLFPLSFLPLPQPHHLSQPRPSPSLPLSFAPHHHPSALPLTITPLTITPLTITPLSPLPYIL